MPRRHQIVVGAKVTVLKPVAPMLCAHHRGGTSGDDRLTLTADGDGITAASPAIVST